MANDSANRAPTIGQLVPGMKNLNVTFIVIDVGPSRRTQQGHDIRTVRVADPTGSILMCVWDTVAEVIKSGEIWRLRNGYTSVFKGALGLSCGKAGDLMKVGEFFMLFSELPNMSEYSVELATKYPMPRKGSPSDENGSNFNGGGNGTGGGNGDHNTQSHFGGKPMDPGQPQGTSALSNHGPRALRRPLLFSRSEDENQRRMDGVMNKFPRIGI
uniref:SOSS complex subunit B1 n=2 Tax=Ascaris TaxID=6251 RepID=A0A0M3HZT3_ASCLU